MLNAAANEGTHNDFTIPINTKCCTVTVWPLFPRQNNLHGVVTCLGTESEVGSQKLRQSKAHPRWLTIFPYEVLLYIICRSFGIISNVGSKYRLVPFSTPQVHGNPQTLRGIGGHNLILRLRLNGARQIKILTSEVLGRRGWPIPLLYKHLAPFVRRNAMFRLTNMSFYCEPSSFLGLRILISLLLSATDLSKHSYYIYPSHLSETSTFAYTQYKQLTIYYT